MCEIYSVKKLMVFENKRVLIILWFKLMILLFQKIQTQWYLKNLYIEHVIRYDGIHMHIMCALNILILVHLFISIFPGSTALVDRRTYNVVPQQSSKNEVPVPASIIDFASVPRGYLERLTKLGQISDHNHIDTLLIPSDNDISISAGYDDPRVKRATDENSGLLKSKNIKAGQIKSFYIKSKNVLADKILGDKIIAERVHVSRDIRKKKKQESGNLNPHTSETIEHNEVNIKHPIENKLPEHNIPSSEPTKSSSEPTKSSKPDLSHFIHDPSLGISGIEFVRYNPRQNNDNHRTSERRRHGQDISSMKSRRKSPGHAYNKFVRKRGRNFKDLFPEGLPKMSEMEEIGAKKEKIDPSKPSSDNSDAGLLKAKEIRSGSISALNIEAKFIRADAIKSNNIDAKFIIMRSKSKKPKLAHFEYPGPDFSVKRKIPSFKASWGVTSKSYPGRRRRVMHINGPFGAVRREPIPKSTSGRREEILDHDPFATGSTFIKNNKFVNDFGA